MNPPETAAPAPITIHSYLTPGDERTLADDVLDGLTRPFKELPPKHFYDAVGAELFDRITELPEYYPTRAERSILVAESARIAQATRAAEVVELGPGTAEKTRVLLGALAAAGTLRRYVPVDVTEAMVLRVADELTTTFDGLEVHGIVGDFERHLEHVPPPGDGPRIVAFLGGTIGNFTPGARRRFLRSLARLLRPGIDHLLLGTDLVKDPRILEAAYNDSAGVTAEFNRNILRVLNRELGADFRPDGFDHVAFFNPDAAQVEMHLRAREAHAVSIAALDLVVEFAAGETIHTESSRKFTRASIEALLASSGFRLERWDESPDAAFALALGRVETLP